MAAAQVVSVPEANAVAQMEERRRIADSALGTTLAEGVSPGPEVLALSERYVAGEITLQELGSSVRAMYGL
jgi:Antitoxin VbhA